MKATGIYRKIDSLGRLVIPVEIRRAYDIDVNHELEIFTQGGYIMLGKRQDKCIMWTIVNKVDTKNNIIFPNTQNIPSPFH